MLVVPLVRPLAMPLVGMSAQGNSGDALVRPGSLSGLVTYTRSGVATGSTPTGLTEVAADVPRFDASGRLIWEGQRTNTVTNPRAIGAVAGTPGTAPTAWGGDVTGRSIGGTALYGDSALLDITYTLAGAGDRQLILETGIVAAAPGEIWSASAYCALMSGSGVSWRLDLEFRTGAGGLISSTPSASISSIDGVVRRQTLTVTAPASTGRITSQIRFVATGATTFRALYGATQQEFGPFASTLALPAAASVAASTRGADNGSFTVGTTGTVAFSAVPGQAAPTGADQTFVSVNNGADANRLSLVNVAGGNSVVLRRVVAGVVTDSAAVATQAPGSVLRGVLTWNGTNAAAKIQGGTWRTFAATSGGFSQGRLGNMISGATALFGAVDWVNRYDNAVDEAGADALLARIP